MKEIRKFPTPFPHSVNFLRNFFSRIRVLVEIKKAETPFVLRVSALYPGSDLNRYERNVHRILSPACLPIPPPGHFMDGMSIINLKYYLFKERNVYPDIYRDVSTNSTTWAFY